MSEQPQDLYFIHWKAPATGATGKGTRAVPKEEAQHYADAANQKEREFPPAQRSAHWIEKA